MALCFRIFGTDDDLPTPREILEVLEESDFEVSSEIEEEDEDDEREWTQLLIYESSLDEPVTVQFLDDDDLQDEIDDLKAMLLKLNGASELNDIKHMISSTVVGFRVEFPEDDDEDENTLIMCHLIAQVLAQKTSGFFTVDNEAIFDEAGDLLIELVEVEDD